MNLQKSFRQALPKLFSYKFTWVSRHKLLQDGCNLVRSFKISLDYYRYGSIHDTTRHDTSRSQSTESANYSYREPSNV